MTEAVLVAEGAPKSSSSPACWEAVGVRAAEELVTVIGPLEELLARPAAEPRDCVLTMLDVEVGPDGVFDRLEVEPFGEPLAILDDDMGPRDGVFAKLDDDMGPLDGDFVKPTPVLLFCDTRDAPFWSV